MYCVGKYHDKDVGCCASTAHSICLHRHPTPSLLSTPTHPHPYPLPTTPHSTPRHISPRTTAYVTSTTVCRYLTQLLFCLNWIYITPSTCSSMLLFTFSAIVLSQNTVALHMIPIGSSWGLFAPVTLYIVLFGHFQIQGCGKGIGCPLSKEGHMHHCRVVFYLMNW